jgi:hypothetical protein
VGASALAIVSFGTVAAKEPSVTSPYSFTVVLATMDKWGLGAFLIWPLAFLVWGLHLFARTSRIPVRSVFLMGGALVLGMGWLLGNWRTGVVHQGPGHVAGLLAIDVVVGILLGVLLLRSRRQPTFATNYAFHWVLFAWIAWGSMPWLGEGI